MVAVLGKCFKFDSAWRSVAVEGRGRFSDPRPPSASEACLAKANCRNALEGLVERASKKFKARRAMEPHGIANPLRFSPVPVATCRVTFSPSA